MSKPSLQDARLYLCTDSRREQGDLTDFLEAVLTNGVDIIQLREKNLEAAEELLVLEVFADAARRHRKLFAVNDRADLATAAGADVLHVGQRDLPPSLARGLVGQSMIIGRSSHSVQEARTAAAEIEVDYFCLGPIWATPTKPGRPATTLDPIREVAAAHPARPWFAIGGIEESNIDEVLAAGAERVVVVRAITEAADPGAAAARLSSRLRGQSG